MITSPKQYVPDSDRAKLERGIKRLKTTRNGFAMAVCAFVVYGFGNNPYLQKVARLALAADKGLHTLLKKTFEGR